MTGMLAVTLDALSDLDAKVALDSQILQEQFYFFTVVVMWLIHAGFMSYEAGVARRKNVMSTAHQEHPDDRRRHAGLLLLRLVDLRLHGDAA